MQGAVPFRWWDDVVLWWFWKIFELIWILGISGGESKMAKKKTTRNKKNDNEED